MTIHHPMNERWRGTEIEPFLGGTLSFIGIRKDGKQLLARKFLYEATGRMEGDWKKVWKSINTEANGQVKNYLLALRTLVQCPQKKIVIWVRGSKSQERGGLWHKFFLEYVEEYYAGSTVIFDDPNEYARLSSEKCEVQYTLGKEPSQYHVLIDDAQMGIDVPTIVPKCAYYSLKKQGEKPYLIAECRQFSHEIKSVKQECPCLVCEQIGIVSRSYETSEKIKANVQVLGHCPCVSSAIREAYVQADLSAMRALVKDYTTGLNPLIITPIEQRASMRVEQILNIKVKNDMFVEQAKLDESQFPQDWQLYCSYRFERVDCQHNQCTCPIIFSTPDKQIKIKGTRDEQMPVLVDLMKKNRSRKREGECHMVKHKVVCFSGTPPDFFFPTELSKAGPAEVMVCEQFLSSYKYPTLFYNPKNSTEKLPGYLRTSYTWKDKTMFVRIERREREYILPVIGRVVSALPLDLRERVKALRPVSQFSIVKTATGEWRIVTLRESPLHLYLSATGDYMLTSNKEAVPFTVNASLAIDFQRGLEVPRELRGPLWYRYRQNKVKEVFSYYKRGLIRTSLARFFLLPSELLKIIEGFVIDAG